MANRDSIKNLVRSKNNRNILVDNNHKKKELQEAFRRASSNAFDPESTGYAKALNKVFSHMLLVPFFDPHVGGEGADVSRLAIAVDFVKNINNSVAILGGDIIDNANIVGATNPNFTKLNPNQSIKVAVDVLNPIKHKIGLGVGGNHGAITGGRNRASGVDIEEQISERLGVPYFLYNGILDVEIKVNIKNIIKKIPLTKLNIPKEILNTLDKDGNIIVSSYSYVSHGNGPFASRPGIVDVAYRIGMNGYQNSDFTNKPIDIILSGDKHAGVSGNVAVKEQLLDDEGKVISQRERMIYVCSCPAMQGLNAYTETFNMPNSSPNVYAIDITKEPVYDEIAGLQFVTKTTTFPILKSNLSELSNYAKEYLAKYGLDKNLEKKIKEITKDKEIIEVLEMI